MCHGGCTLINIRPEMCQGQLLFPRLLQVLAKHKTSYTFNSEDSYILIECQLSRNAELRGKKSNVCFKWSITSSFRYYLAGEKRASHVLYWTTLCLTDSCCFGDVGVFLTVRELTDGCKIRTLKGLAADPDILFEQTVGGFVANWKCQQKINDSFRLLRWCWQQVWQLTADANRFFFNA